MRTPPKTLLASVDSALQWFREKARSEDRRSDAQHYADTQWLLRRDTNDVLGVTTAEAFIVFKRGDTTSRTVCAFCHQEISKTILTPCCESSRRCQERQANVKVRVSE